MQKNLDYCDDLTPAFPTILEDSLILAMLALKVELNNKLENNLAKEEYLPFTIGLIAMSSLEKRSFFPIVVIPRFSSVESSSKVCLTMPFHLPLLLLMFHQLTRQKTYKSTFLLVLVSSLQITNIPSPVPKK